MIRGMNFVSWRELQLEGDWVDLPQDGEGANISGTKFLAGQAHTDVPR